MGFFVYTSELNGKVATIMANKLIAGANITITPTGEGDLTISSTGEDDEGVAGVATYNGRSGTVTSVKADYSTWFVDLLGTYANPAWITGLVWSKISGTPTTVAGYGILDALSETSSNILTNKTINSADNVITITTSRVTGLDVALSGKEPTITNLPATKGGTGFVSYAVGDILTAVSTTALQKRTPTQFKADISLDQVQNTTDLNKPISTATQTALTTLTNSLTTTNSNVTNRVTYADLGLQPQITLTYSAGAATWNMALGVNAIITISGNVVITITASSFLTTYSPVLRIVQTGLRGYTVTIVYSGATIYYSGGVLGNKLLTESTYRAIANLRLVNNEIDVSIDPTYTTTP